jgi:hypothetical protein
MAISFIEYYNSFMANQSDSTETMTSDKTDVINLKYKQERDKILERLGTLCRRYQGLMRLDDSPPGGCTLKRDMSQLSCDEGNRLLQRLTAIESSLDSQSISDQT